MALLNFLARGASTCVLWRTCSMLSLALVLLGAPGNAAAQSAPEPEYRVKAVFLYHFTQFVTWPASAFTSPDAPLVIGVLGDDPFGRYLDEAVRGESINGHRMVVRRYGRAADARAAHIVFLGLSERNGLRAAVSAMNDRPVLTVSDREDFARSGGIVQFVNERGRIRLRINAAAAREAGLTISSKLLGLADVIMDGES